MLRKFTIIATIIGFFIVLETQASEIKIKEEEKAVYAFFQLIDAKPKYDFWVKNRLEYEEASRYERKKMLEDETARLKWGFENYNAEEDLITIKANIRVTTGRKEDGSRYIYTRFVDDRHNRFPYFPYFYGTEAIAFIIQDLEKFSAVKLKPEEIPKVKQYFFSSAPYEAVMEMRIRPVSADSQGKLEVDGQLQWLMLGEIAYLKINYYDDYKLGDVAVWDYNAPWYLEESQKALLNMFKEPEKEEEAQ